MVKDTLEDEGGQILAQLTSWVLGLLQPRLLRDSVSLIYVDPEP